MHGLYRDSFAFVFILIIIELYFLYRRGLILKTPIALAVFVVMLNLVVHVAGSYFGPEDKILFGVAIKNNRMALSILTTAVVAPLIISDWMRASNRDRTRDGFKC